jgi:hypothetical protein
MNAAGEAVVGRPPAGRAPASGVTFEAFARRERRPLVAFAWSLTGDLGRAEDLAQDALEAAWQVWDRVGGYDKPGAWARRRTAQPRGSASEQEPTARAVREAESSDVHGLRVVRADHVSEAHVHTESTEARMASGQPVDLHVPVHRLPAGATGRLARGIEAVGQVGDRPLEALRDGHEVLLVAGDQRRVGVKEEVVGKDKHAGSQGVHGVSSDLRPLAAMARSKASAPRRDDPGGHDEQRSA